MYISASAPDAPPLSETTIGCFIRLFFWIAACIIRAIWSDAPPAPAATTISTGLLGSQATAGAAASAIARAAAPARQVLLISGISSSSSHGPSAMCARPLVLGAHSAALRLRCKGAGRATGAPRRKVATSFQRRSDIAELLRALSGIYLGR